MKNIYYLSYLVFISLTFTYEPTTIKGQVLDNNNKPIEKVYVSSNVDQFYTDTNGNFIILYDTNSTNIKFSKIGYKDIEVNINTKKNNLTINLERQNIYLPEINISEISVITKQQKSANDIHILSEYDFKPGDIHFDNSINKIPNINYTGGTSRTRFFQIRGIGELSQYAGEGGPNYYVATIIDDIDLSGIGMPIFLDNISQIEIFQGPQSYSYGHNAMAGLINIKSIEPDIKNANNFKLTKGNDELLQFSYLHQSQPLLNDKLLANFFIYQSAQNGFMYNSFLDDYRNNKFENLQKLKLNYNSNDIFSSKLTFINSYLNNGYDAWSPNNNPDTTYSNQPGVDSQKLKAASIRNELNFNKFSIINISNYLDSDMNHSYDSDWGNDDFWSQEPYNVEYWSYEYYQNELRRRYMSSHEFRFISYFDENTTNALGYYYKNLEEKDNATGWILGGEDVALKSIFNITNHALFNELKYTYGKFMLTTNARVEQVNLRYKSTHYHEEYVDYDYYNPIYDTTYVNTDYHDMLSAGKISLLYSINEQNNFYFTLSNGYKAGGVNQNPRLSTINRIFKPEFNQNFDLGYKFKNENTALNVNLFYMNRDDLQVTLSSQQDSDNPNSFYFYTSNASNGYNSGVTMNFKKVYEDNFESYVNLGYLKTQINSFTYFIDQDTKIEFQERDAAHAPSYTVSWGFSKHFDNFRIGADIHAKDRFYFDYSHNEQSEPYSITNIHIGYNVNSNLDVSIWSKNIFNTKYATRGFFFGVEPPNYENKLYLSYGDPFTIGMTINYKF